MATSVSNAGGTLEQTQIATVRQAWMQAVRDGDTNRLANLLTGDVVAVLKDGLCICGKEASASGPLALQAAGRQSKQTA